MRPVSERRWLLVQPEVRSSLCFFVAQSQIAAGSRLRGRAEASVGRQCAAPELVGHRHIVPVQLVGDGLELAAYPTARVSDES